MKRSLLYTLLFCLSLSLYSVQGQVSYRSETPYIIFAKGKKMFQVHNYNGCIDLLTHFKTLSKDTKLNQEADYMIAVSSYANRSPQALKLLEKFIEQYGWSSDIPKARMLIGNLYLFDRKYEKANRQYALVDMERLSPEDQEEYLFRAGLSQLKSGNTEKAKPYFSALSSVGKKYREASIYYNAYIDYTGKQYNGAKAGFSQVKNNPEFGANAKYYLAQIALNDQQYGQVIQEGLQLLSEYPDHEFNSEINRIVGESYYYEGDNDNAIQYLNRYVTNTKDPLRESLYLLGIAYFKSGNYPSAIEYLKQTTTGNDALMQNAYLYLGQSYLKTGDKTNARLAFDIASRYDFDRQVQETALYNYALNIHESTVSPFGESVTVFEKFLNLFPSSRYADAINDYLVDVYMTSRNYGAALNSINKIKRPTDKIMKAKQRILFRLGTESFTNNNLSEARKYFSSAIQLGNYDANARSQAYLWKGECDYREGKFADAAANYRQYLSSNKNIDPLARYNLGYAYFKQHDFVSARNSFRQYVNSSKESSAKNMIADAWNRIGDCFYSARQFAQAEESYAKAREIAPTTGDYALYQKGIMAGLQRKYNEKISILQNLLQDYPHSEYIDDALLEQGLTYTAIQQNDRAVSVFEKLIRECPQTVPARKAGIQLGIAYFNSNQPEKSIAAYKQVIGNYPGSDEAKVAIDDLKAVYLDQNDIAAYASSLESLGGAVKYEVSELDSLAFLAAERAFLKAPTNSSADGLIKYIQTYPEGAFLIPAHYYLGSFYYDQKKYDEAEAELQKVLQQPDSPLAEETLVKLSDIQVIRKEYPTALNTYKVLEIKATGKENRLTARLGILRMAKELKQNEEIIAIANKLLEDPNLSPEWMSEARYEKANALVSTGNIDKAAEEWKILSRDTRTSQGAEAAYRLAQYYFDRQKSADAEKEINLFIEAGTSHQYWLARAFILLADINIAKKENFQAKQYLLSLQNNYNAQDDIQNMIENRLKQIGK